MALSTFEHQQVLAHINRTWTTRTCPMCGANHWALSGVVQLLMNSTGASPLQVTPGTLMMPTAAMLCQNCGNTVLINMMIAGALGGSR